MTERNFIYSQKKKKCYFFSLSGYQSDPECIKKFDELIKKIDIYKVENKSFIQKFINSTDSVQCNNIKEQIKYF